LRIQLRTETNSIQETHAVPRESQTLANTQSDHLKSKQIGKEAHIMASNEIEVLDPAATVEKLRKIAAGRALNRRSFMAALGMTSAAAGAAFLSGCTATTTVAVATSGPGQTDVLNFALNLEYLESTFYSYITQGADLPASTGATTGSGAITGAPAKITTFSAQITDILNEIYYDELQHVVDLRTLLGSAAIARPALNLAAAGTITNTAAPYALSIARQFEDVGATAYAGAAALLSSTNLTYAAQILAVEGFHAGALRFLSIQNPTIAPYVQADSLDVKPYDPGTAALAAAGPTANGAFFATSGAATASAATPTGFAFTRTTSQVLSIVYGGAASGSSKGGFFPNGMNGLINTV
jgi:hypothetical protein